MKRQSTPPSLSISASLTVIEGIYPLLLIKMAGLLTLLLQRLLLGRKCTILWTVVIKGGLDLSFSNGLSTKGPTGERVIKSLAAVAEAEPMLERANDGRKTAMGIGSVIDCMLTLLFSTLLHRHSVPNVVARYYWILKP